MMPKNDGRNFSGKRLTLSSVFCIIYFLGLLCILNIAAALFVGSFPAASAVIIALSFVELAALIFLFLLILRMRDSIRKTYVQIKKIADPENTHIDPNTVRLDQIDEIYEMAGQLDVTKQQQYPYQLLQKQAQLDALQHQINPHFLYNALESIRGLAIQQSAEETADMVEALSTLFRFSISKTNDFIPLSQELANIDNYIKIQKYRFNNRFDLHKEIELSAAQLNEYRIPKLTLQPIVENALEHGLKDIRASGLISLRIVPTQTRLLISISDNGFGMDDNLLRSLNERFLEPVSNSSISELSTKSNGIALINVDTRLKLIFGNRFGLTAYSTKNLGTEIQISLPLITEEIKGSAKP